MKTNNTQKLRRVAQGACLALGAGFLELVILGGKYVIHQACPYAVVCFGLSGSNFIRLGNNLLALAIIVGFAILIYTMFFGRRFCAWVCPLGTIQEAIYSLREKKYRINHRTPYYVERKLAWVKYFVLTATATLVVLGLRYLYFRLCPLYALSQLPRLAWPGLVLFGLIVFKAFFDDRQWCRYLCPYAALMNIFQRLGDLIGIRRRKVKRNLERCTDCGVCNLYCPMDINIAESEYVNNPNCIHCGLCAQACPKPGTYCEERECEK